MTSASAAMAPSAVPSPATTGVASSVSKSMRTAGMMKGRAPTTGRLAVREAQCPKCARVVGAAEGRKGGSRCAAVPEPTLPLAQLHTAVNVWHTRPLPTYQATVPLSSRAWRSTSQANSYSFERTVAPANWITTRSAYDFGFRGACGKLPVFIQMDLGCSITVNNHRNVDQQPLSRSSSYGVGPGWQRDQTRRSRVMPDGIIHMFNQFSSCVINVVVGVLTPDGISAALILIVALLSQTGEDL